MITFLKSSSDLYHILFGNVLAVRSSDMWITFGIGIFILLAVIVFYKELLISSFDPVISSVYGLPNRMIHYFLMTLLTLVTVASLQTVGIILVVAMLITPAATAYLLTDRLWIMIYLSAFSGQFLPLPVLGLVLRITCRLVLLSYWSRPFYSGVPLSFHQSKEFYGDH